METFTISKNMPAMLSAALLLSGTNAVLAEDADGTFASELASEVAVFELVGGAPTYRVGYMYSTTNGPRKAMAISITNNSSNPCDTTVRWRAGGNQLIGTSSVVIPAGQTLEHCSRQLPGATVICNAVSDPQVAPPEFVEGKADIHLALSCRNRANVDAKQYYMRGNNDRNIASVHRVATIRGVRYRGD